MIHELETESKKPLPPMLPEVAEMTPELIPEAARGWAEDVAKRLSCPLDFTAVAALSVSGAALGSKLSIRPKARDNWEIKPNFYASIIANSGATKSPALMPMLKPLSDIDAAFQESNREAAKRDAEAAERFKLQLEEARKQARADGGESFRMPDEPEPSRKRRVLVNNATSEKLAELMGDNPSGILLFRDEIAGWISELGRSGREGERSFYLEAANGSGSFTFDRIGRGTMHVENICASILGSIQPGPLGKLLKAEGDAGKEDGLLQRFSLLCWPNPQPYKNVDTLPDTAAREKYHSFIEWCHKVNLGEGLVVGELEPFSDTRYLRFSPDAQSAFNDWLVGLMNEIQAGELPAPFASHLSKYRKAIPSIALITELGANRDAESISLESWKVAERWADYLRSHARRVFAPTVKAEIVAAHLIANRLDKLPAEFTARDIYIKGWMGLEDATAATAALSVLVDAGWLTMAEVETGGRPSIVYSRT